MVIDGAVDLRGKVGRKTTAMLVAHLCASVPGVVEVRDHLSLDFDDAEMTTSGYFRSHPFSTEFKK